MNPDLIQQALIDAIKTTAQSRGLTPHLPGYEYEAVTTPGIVIDFTPIDRPNVTLKGGEIDREEGQITIAVVVEQGEGTNGAHAHANALAAALNTAAFNAGANLTFTGGGKIQLSKPADIRPGYPDGSHWRVPVVASYIAGMRTA